MRTIRRQSGSRSLLPVAAMAVIAGGCALIIPSHLDATTVFTSGEARLVTLERSPSAAPTATFLLVDGQVTRDGTSMDLTYATDDGWRIVLSALSVEGPSGIVSIERPGGAPASDGPGWAAVGQVGDGCRLVLTDVDLEARVAGTATCSAMNVDGRRDQVAFAVIEFDATVAGTMPGSAP